MVVSCLVVASAGREAIGVAGRGGVSEKTDRREVVDGTLGAVADSKSSEGCRSVELADDRADNIVAGMEC